ncbi:MAG: hypothetical protein JNM24_15420 [Bdellovibrionaceae bacterium]|nr:hypothetical protein [Pseudobdellovibrionaceae bacterium]
MKTILLVLLAILTSVNFAFAQKGGKGGGSTGGTNNETINVQYLEYLLNGPERILKNAVKDYLNSMDVNEIADPLIKKLFMEDYKISQFIDDINRSHYVNEPNCKDEHNKIYSASAGIGEFGGKICFDLAALAKDYQGLTTQGVLIQLAAVALHEHLHHLQKDAERNLKPEEKEAHHMALEKEAYRLSVYVLLTAKLTQPSLFWSQKIGEESKIMSARTQELCDKYSDRKRKVNIRISGQKDTVTIWRDLLDEVTTTRNISYTLVAVSSAAATIAGIVAAPGVIAAFATTSVGRGAVSALAVGVNAFYFTGFITQIGPGVYIDLVKGDSKMNKLYKDLVNAIHSIPFYSESNVAAMEGYIANIDEAAKKVDFNWSRWENGITFGQLAKSRIQMMYDLQDQKMKVLEGEKKFLDGVLMANGCK